MLRLTVGDRDKIRGLLRSSSDVKNLLSNRMLVDIMDADDPFMVALADAQKRNVSIHLHSNHIVVYDLMIEGDHPMEHLSISHPKIDEADALVIATEFGLGDRSTWTMYIPAQPPRIKAFHIMRKLGK